MAQRRLLVFSGVTALLVDSDFVAGVFDGCAVDVAALVPAPAPIGSSKMTSLRISLKVWNVPSSSPYTASDFSG